MSAVIIRDVRILHAQNLEQNRPACAEFGVLHRLEENLPNDAENAKILLIFVNPFTSHDAVHACGTCIHGQHLLHVDWSQCRVQHHATHAQQLYCLRKVHDCTCNTDRGWHLCTSQPLSQCIFNSLRLSVSWVVTLRIVGWPIADTLPT